MVFSLPESDIRLLNPSAISFTDFGKLQYAYRNPGGHKLTMGILLGEKSIEKKECPGLHGKDIHFSGNLTCIEELSEVLVYKSGILPKRRDP
jgi:hypothetical protein